MLGSILGTIGPGLSLATLKCFPATVGGFHVTFSGQQILRGTYGGAEGIDVPNDRSVGYLYYYSISVSPPCEPIMIQRQTPIPLENQ